MLVCIPIKVTLKVLLMKIGCQPHHLLIVLSLAILFKYPEIILYSNIHNKKNVNLIQRNGLFQKINHKTYETCRSHNIYLNTIWYLNTWSIKITIENTMSSVMYKLVFTTRTEKRCNVMFVHKNQKTSAKIHKSSQNFDVLNPRSWHRLNSPRKVNEKKITTQDNRKLLNHYQFFQNKINVLFSSKTCTWIQ